MNKKKLTTGIILLATFLAVLIAIFMPWYGKGANGRDRNGLEFSDDFFNSLAKGSSNYMADMRKVAVGFKGQTFEVQLKFKDAEVAQKAELLYTQAGAAVELNNQVLKIKADMGQVMLAAIYDAEVMFHNHGDRLTAKYNLEPKAALKTWWISFQEMDKALKKQATPASFKQAAALIEISKRSIEPGYNFYGISPEPVSNNILLLTFMLVFYVVYTLWYGYGVFEIFEGFGLGAEAGHKEEV